MSDQSSAKEWTYKAWDAQAGVWLSGKVSLGSDTPKEKVENYVRGLLVNQPSGVAESTTRVVGTRVKGITEKVMVGKAKKRPRVRITKMELTPVIVEEVYNPVIYLIEPVDQGPEKPVGYKLTVGNEQTKAKFFEIEVLDGESSDVNECAVEALVHQIKGGRIIKR